MVSWLVAALACAIATPQSRAADAAMSIDALVAADVSASRALAMSLPAELGPLSSPALEPAGSFDVPAAADRRATVAPMTPLEVDSVMGASARADWSALATHFDEAGSCCFLVPAGHARTAMLRAARGRAAHHVVAGAISAAPEPLLPDGHGAPILGSARLAMAPPPVVATLALPSPSTPLAPPGSRIDRPPRS
jgi:hypothetical protein